MDQKQLEAEVEAFAQNLLSRHRADQTAEQRSDGGWPVVKALIHRAIHLAAGPKAAEFCTLASYLGEMVGHAHGLMHASDPKSPSHHDHLH